MARDGWSRALPRRSPAQTGSGPEPAAARSFDESSMSTGTFEDAANVLERICLLGFLVGAPPEHAWESHRDAGAVPRRRGDSLKAKLEDVHRFDVPDRAETFPRMPPDPLVHLGNLFVR